MSVRAVTPAVAAVDRSVQRARAAGWVTAIATYLLGFLAVATLKAMPQDSSLYDLLELVAQWAWVAGPLFGYLAYARLLPVGGPIVWLRHFQPRSPARSRFAVALGRASIGIGHPLTLQDASVSASMYAAGVRLPAVALWLAVPLLWLVGIVAVVSAGTALGLEDSALVLGLLGSTLGTGLLVRAALRRFGFRALPAGPARAVAEIKARTAAMRRGRGRVGLGIEVVRYRGEGELWKAVVHAALEDASVAVIDVTDWPRWEEHLRFEFGTALVLLGPGRVLLTAEAEAETASEDRIWSGVCEPAQRESGRRLDRRWLHESLHRYPAAAPRYGPEARRAAEHEVGRLRAALASRAPAARSPAVRA